MAKTEAPKRPFYKKKRFLIPVGLIALFIIIGAAGSNNAPMGNVSTTATATPAPAQKFDLTAFYNAVQNGMTKDEVVQLAGRNATNCSVSEYASFGKAENCNWSQGFSMVSVSFTNDAVSSKSQY